MRALSLSVASLILLVSSPAFADEPTEVDLDALKTECHDPCSVIGTIPPELGLKDALDLADRAHEKVSALEKAMRGSVTRDEFNNLKDRVAVLEAEVAQLKLAIIDLNQRVSGLELQIANILDRLNALEPRVDDLEDRVDVLESVVASTSNRMWYGGGFAAIGLDVHPPIGTVVPTPVSFIAGGGGLIGGEGDKSGSVLECGAFAYFPNGYGGDCQIAHYWKGKKGKTAHGVVYGVSGHAYGVGRAGADSFEHLASFVGVQAGSYHRLTLTQGRGGALDLVIEPRVRAGRAGVYNGDPAGVVGFIPLIKIQYRKFWEDNPPAPVE